MEIVSIVVDKITGQLVDPIGRQFDYVCCYKSNIENLRSEDAKLRNIQQGMEQRVSFARRDLHSIGHHIQEWLKDAERINSEVERILFLNQKAEQGCLKGLCPNMKSRYTLSRRAKKKIEEIIKLQNDAKDHLIFSHPVASTGLEHVAAAPMVEFDSRKIVEENIISALKDKNVTKVGLCGMGGVGKTLMAKKIGKIMRDESIFNEVVTAVVGQEPDPKKIQGEIADGLGLTLEDKSLAYRAGKLYQRIMGEKKILIILDDVWRRLDLTEIGIPSSDVHKGCKILLTTRLRNVCTAMEAEEISVTILSEAEAWNLFIEHVGDAIEDSRILHIARDVALECKGLPLALATVGRSLRNKNKRYWEDVLKQLQKALPRNIPGLLSEVYRPLELSYSSLESDEAKILLRMSCLFPEDAYIPVHTLVRYGMGLDIFAGVEKLEEARNRVRNLVEMLKDQFLLVANDDENYVHVHDVVRDVVKFIASEEKHMLVSHDINSNKWPSRSYEDFAWISIISGAFDGLPESLDCPRLEMLLLECNFGALKAVDRFFTGMQRLKVLEMQDFYIPSLPSSIRSCTNLRTLQLHGCEFVEELSGAEEDISEEVLSMIAQLVNLEILSLSYSSIKALPSALGDLRNLRMLDLTGCKYLNEIKPGIISRLVGLEEIYLKKSFANWGTKIEGKEGHNISLVELESLLKLTTLAILIPDAHLIPKNLHLSSDLTNYDLSVGVPSEIGKEIPNGIGKNYEKVLSLNLPFSQSFVGSFLYMLKNAEYLYSTGEGSNSAIDTLASEGFQNLKQLHLDSCSSVRHLANTSDIAGSIFPVLEKIYLGSISCLKEICHGQLPAGSFEKLRHMDFKKLPMLTHLWKSPTQDISLANLVSVSLDECHRLQNLFSRSIALTLLQLEQLKVTKCKTMDEIVSDEGGSLSKEIEFPKLRHLELGKLRNFSRFCDWIHGIHFPHLNHLRLSNLSKLKCFFGKNDGSDSGAQHDTEDNVQSLFDQKKPFESVQRLEVSGLASVTNLWSRNLATGIFNALEELKVISCHGLKNLFSPNIAKGLVNIKELEIRDCSAMEEIIEKNVEEDKEEESSTLSLFPQLEMLKLFTLEDLKRFSNLKHDVEMGLLEYLEIKDCPKLSTFNPGSIKTPNLKVLKVDDQQIETNDVNNAVKQRFQEKDEILPEKNYIMLPATDLSIISGADNRNWDWPTMKESSGDSFVVAELIKVWRLDICGRFETASLSPGVTYEVAFVVMLREPTKGWEEPVNLRLVLPNGAIIDRTEKLKAKPRSRWFELQLGDFEVSPDETGAIEFALLQQNAYVVKRGLVIKGVIVRPKA